VARPRDTGARAHAAARWRRSLARSLEASLGFTARPKLAAREEANRATSVGVATTFEALQAARWLDWAVLATAALATAMFASRLLRRPWREAGEWWAVVGLAGVATALLWPLGLDSAGAAGLAIVMLLGFGPQRADRSATLAAFRGDDRTAFAWATLAGALHPIGALRRRAATLRAAAEVRDGLPLDRARIEALGAEGQPELVEAYRVLAAVVAADFAAAEEAMRAPLRRHALLALGLGVTWVRIVGATRPADDVLGALVEAEQWDPSLADPERRLAAVLEACAALGDREGVARITAASAGRRPRGTFERVRVAVAAKSGDIEGARALAKAALASPDLSRAARVAIDHVTPSRLGGSAPAMRAEDPRWSRLTAMREEALALASLASLTGPSPTPPLLTWGLSALLIAIFALLGPPELEGWRYGAGLLAPLPLPMRGLRDAPRLVGYALLHASWEHVLVNVGGLIAIGGFVEAFFGRIRMLVIALVAAIAGGLGASLLARRDAADALVGASGAIMGFGGALVAALLVRRELRRSRAGRRELWLFVGLLVAQTLADRLTPEISGAAHLFGLGAGVLVGAALAPAPAQAGRSSGSSA
jgi:membrane associated rhomboid family serine protease